MLPSVAMDGEDTMGSGVTFAGTMGIGDGTSGVLVRFAMPLSASPVLAASWRNFSHGLVGVVVELPPPLHAARARVSDSESARRRVCFIRPHLSQSTAKLNRVAAQSCAQD